MNNRPTPETDEFSKKQYIRMAASSNNAVDLLNDALEETENHARKLERERDEARAERDILRLNSLGTIQLNIPVTTDWKEETNDDHEQL